MMVLKATRRFDGYAYAVRRDRELICSTSDEQLMAAQLLQVGVEKPEPLIAAARQWGIVQIHEGEGQEQPNLSSVLHTIRD